MPIPLILAPIISMLAGKGLSMLSSAVESAGDKAVEFVKEKTGLDISSPEKVAALTPEQTLTLKQLESSERLALANLALQYEIIDSNERIAASNERTAWIQADDTYTRQTRPLILRIFAYASIAFIFITPLAFAITMHILKLPEGVAKALIELITFLGGFLFTSFTVGWTSYISSRKTEKLATVGFSPPTSLLSAITSAMQPKK